MLLAPFMTSNTMHDSVKQSAAPAAQQGRTSSEGMFGFNNHFITSPDSVQIKIEPREYPHQSTIGLDVIHGVEVLPVTQSVSVHGWQDQHIPGTTACYNTAVSAPEYNNMPYYPPQYTNSTLVDTSSIQYPVFTSSAQTQPLYYSSGYNTSPSGNPDFAQNSTRRWPMTPQSHISTPERIAEQELHRTSPTETTWSSPIMLDENLQTKKRKGYAHANYFLEHTKAEAFERSLSPHDTESTLGSEISQRSSEGSISPRPSAKGFQKKSATPENGHHDSDAELSCRICGKKFTRRSNCREHMKRHNPENRKVHSCDSCGRTFGRKTDLRRHYSTVSTPPDLNLSRQCQFVLIVSFREFTMERKNSHVLHAGDSIAESIHYTGKPCFLVALSLCLISTNTNLLDIRKMAAQSRDDKTKQEGFRPRCLGIHTVPLNNGIRV
jgi:Zinc finger, C2H2 type